MSEYQELIERLEFEFDHEAAEAIRALITRAETAEKRLAEAVAVEREACAKIAAQGLHASMWAAKFKAVAAVIRARGSAEAQNGRPNND